MAIAPLVGSPEAGQYINVKKFCARERIINDVVVLFAACCYNGVSEHD